MNLSAWQRPSKPEDLCVLPFLKVTWGLIALMALINVLWITFGGWNIQFAWLIDTFRDILALTVIMLIVYKLKLGADVFIFINSALQCVMLPVVGLVLCYLMASLAPPLRDETFIAIDHALGFDWLTYAAWLNQHPLLAKLLTLSYDSMVMQMSLALPVLCVVSRMDHMQRYIMLLIVTSFITIVLASTWPALGAYIHYKINLADYPNLHPAAPFLHESALQGLRDGTMRTIGYNMQGIVTFPSFHTMAGVIMIYVAWPIRWLLPVVLPLNILMIISTLVDGGHYLTDVLAGIIIALLAIVFTGKCLPNTHCTRK